MFAILIMLAAQQVSADAEPPVQRVSERLHSIYPTTSCDRQLAQRQSRLIDRRFAKRMSELRRKDVKLNGVDLGFDLIALRTCLRKSVNFDDALRKFDNQLTVIEREFYHVR